MKTLLKWLIVLGLLGNCQSGILTARGHGAAIGALFGGAVGSLVGGLSGGGKGAAIGFGTDAMAGAFAGAAGSSNSRYTCHQYNPYHRYHPSYRPAYVPCSYHVNPWVDTINYRDRLYDVNEQLKSEYYYLIDIHKQQREENKSLHRKLERYSGDLRVSHHNREIDDHRYYQNFKIWKTISSISSQNEMLSDINDELRYKNRKIKKENCHLSKKLSRCKKRYPIYLI